MSSKKCIIIFNTWTPTRDLGFGIWDFGFKGNEWLKLTTELYGEYYEDYKNLVI